MESFARYTEIKGENGIGHGYGIARGSFTKEYICKCGLHTVLGGNGTRAREEPMFREGKFWRIVCFEIQNFSKDPHQWK